MTRPGEAPVIVGTAVLRDYPLRLWAAQQEHSQEVLREFNLLLIGRDAGAADAAPAQLVALAEMFTVSFGALIDELTTARAAALESGLDRIDSPVPLPEGSPELFERVRTVLDAVDEYCRRGDLLALARTPLQVAFSAWSLSELTAQYGGADPTPWPGPW